MKKKITKASELLKKSAIEAQVNELLIENELKRTEIRVKVLALFLNHNHALSKQEIEEGLEEFDRITLYRTLKSFEENYLIHKIFDNTENIKYALNNSLLSKKKNMHEEAHIHFFCTNCERTYCLPMFVPKVALPDRFQGISYNYSVQGFCNSCIK